MPDTILSRSKSAPLWPQFQVGALCHRMKAGKIEVLLVTSRGSGRWLVPKGWPIAGLDGAGAALQEAWEEAGVKLGRVAAQPVGQYSYFKRGTGRSPVHMQVLLYPVLVEKTAHSFPECDERRRRWVSAKRASKMVQEPDLAAILRHFRPVHGH